MHMYTQSLCFVQLCFGLRRVRSSQQYRGFRQWRLEARFTSTPTAPSRTSWCWTWPTQMNLFSASCLSPLKTTHQCPGVLRCHLSHVYLGMQRVTHDMTTCIHLGTPSARASRVAACDWRRQSVSGAHGRMRSAHPCLQLKR